MKVIKLFLLFIAFSSVSYATDIRLVSQAECLGEDQNPAGLLIVHSKSSQGLSIQGYVFAMDDLTQFKNGVDITKLQPMTGPVDYNPSTFDGDAIDIYKGSYQADFVRYKKCVDLTKPFRPKRWKKLFGEYLKTL